MAKKEEAVIPMSPFAVQTVVETNNAVREEKMQRLLAAGSVIQQVSDEAEDEIANNFLVKAGKTLKTVEELRKTYSAPLNAWLSAQIEPEKKIQAEIDRIRAFRNNYANELDRQAKQKQQEIQRQKDYDAHVAIVKGRMREAVETAVVDKLVALEKAVAGVINAMTLESWNADQAKLNISPKLKADFFDKLFEVTYDANLMTPEQFKEIQGKAKAYYTYDFVNDAYVKKADAILKKWKEQIPFKVKELQAIAAGDSAAKAAAAKRIEDEQKEIEDNARKERQNISNAAAAEVNDGTMRAEFNAQVQEQSIETTNAITRRKFKIDGQSTDMMKLSAIVSKIMINMIGEKSFKGVYKLDENGNPKLDEDGDPIYVDGIQFWLNQLPKLGRHVNIAGLVMTEFKATQARAK